MTFAHRFRSTRAATAVAAAVAAVLLPTGASAAAAQPRWEPTGPHAAAQLRQITLITGDTVRVRGTGAQRRVDVVPAPRPDGDRPTFLISQHGGDLTVIPQDVSSLLPTRLDPRLFDITDLLAQGYGNSHNSALRLIVTYRGGTMRAAAALPGTDVTRQLPAVHGAALRLDKQHASAFGRALDRLAAPTMQPPRTSALSGIDKVWLDARVHVNADPDDEQIGAPTLWQRGDTGTGVEVAVLDTGIDAGHPDLADRVVAAKNFSGTADVSDHFGHGTHVASIIAGTGAASGGEHRGVAYGATLLNGKVLNDDGFGFASSVIAGMEWASTDEHAPIVNISLGFEPGAFGSGPVTDAVERLTKANGTLFVVAAGNGSCQSCIGAPADAPSALTVGAVDGNDRLADFSSQGPVPGTYGLKPDITAPGVDIVAARAAGTSLGTPVDANYTTLSGTSMAAPHVAGAAALLLQTNPDLTGADLKAELMDTAQPTAGTSVYAQGAGRVDVARAADDTLVADTGSLDYGFFSYPHAGRAPVERTVTYRNLADHPVTVGISADVRDADGSSLAGFVTATPDRLTIPAGGSAATTVALDTTRPGSGLFGGAITAIGDDGSSARTVLGFDKEPTMYNLTVNAIARDGRPAVGTFHVFDVHDGRVDALRAWPGVPDAPCTSSSAGARNCVRVPAGTYSIMGYVYTMPPGQPSTVKTRTVLNTTLVGNPELSVHHDMTITLDARDANEVRIKTPAHPEATANLGGAMQMRWTRVPEHGAALSDTMWGYPGAQLEEKFFEQSSAQVTVGDFGAYARYRLEQPVLGLAVEGGGIALHPTYYDPVWFSDVSSQYPRLDGEETLRVVDIGTATPDEIDGRDLHGTLALVRRSDGISVADQSNNAAAAGARFVAIYNDGPGDNADPGRVGVKLQVPTVRLSHAEGIALLALVHRRTVVVKATGVTASRYLYDILYRQHGGIPAHPVFMADADSTATVVRHFAVQPDSPMTLSEVAWSYLPGDTFSTSTYFPLIGAPRTRTDYYVADPDVRWAYGVVAPEDPHNYLWPEPDSPVELGTTGAVAYRPGEHLSDRWFAGPIAPGLRSDVPLQRAGNLMRVHLAAFVGAAGHVGDSGTTFSQPGIRAHFVMYADGTPIADTVGVPDGIVAVPAGAGDYRIIYDVGNDNPWATLSTSTSSEWTFHSDQPASGEVVTQPLLVADYDLDTDLRNVVRLRHQPVQLGINLAHQQDAAQPDITSVHLDASVDDGTTWRSVPVRAAGGGHYAAAIAPDVAAHRLGYVSLRLHVTDAAGGTLSQQVIRAFAVAPPGVR